MIWGPELDEQALIEISLNFAYLTIDYRFVVTSVGFLQKELRFFDIYIKRANISETGFELLSKRAFWSIFGHFSSEPCSKVLRLAIRPIWRRQWRGGVTGGS